MKKLLLLLVCSVNVIYAQNKSKPNTETFVKFESKLIDYDVHDGKIVALVENNRENFIYFSDENGAKLFETIDVSSPTGLEVDCLGNLQVLSQDSAVQLEIGNTVSRSRSMELAKYHSSISNCEAYFSENIVRRLSEGLLVYEPIEDARYKETPIISRIQFWKMHSPVASQTSDLVRLTGENASRGTEEKSHRFYRQNSDGTVDEKDLEFLPEERNSNVVNGQRTNKLTSFQCSDSLWVFDRVFKRLLFYSDAGRLKSSVSVKDIETNDLLVQDPQDNSIYLIRGMSKSYKIMKVNPDGTLSNETRVKKHGRVETLRVLNATLYYSEDLGNESLIRRVNLN